MATLLLTTVGTLVGGPIGGAIGAFAGQQIDVAIFGSGSYEGPRLKDLAVTTSSYGQPLTRHFGTMRAAGTVIWATELKESRESSGGGKGKPKTTTYSYSASFAVALSGRPIHGVGRIWADGDLLRGAAGDLKTAGSIRIYDGAQDQPVDPLIAAAEGASAPAFRDCAYVVFEDLELGDFGNRIPALTFEVQADASAAVDLSDILRREADNPSHTVLPDLLGFADEGGELISSLKVLDQLYPMQCSGQLSEPKFSLQSSLQPSLLTLPEPIAWLDDGNENGASTFEKKRASASRPRPHALRYYDRDRDYQPGVQRSEGTQAQGREFILQFPGTLTANSARTLCAETALRSQWVGETITWRIAQIDESFSPGSIVRLPGQPGHWSINQWEWLERGVELQLKRVIPQSGSSPAGDSGWTNPPSDLAIEETLLNVFELPWDGAGSQNDPVVYAATSAASEGWRGAYLYLEQAGSLVGLGPASSNRAVMGALVTSLGPSACTHLERHEECEIELVGTGLTLENTTVGGIAGGANRLWVGGEIMQFLCAVQLTDTRWRISGLLRGRGGTEAIAQAGHELNVQAILLDDRLTVLDPAQVPSSVATQIAAIGLGDSEPQTTALAGVGTTRRPLSPVHARHHYEPNGDLALCWTRRARGQWDWPDYIDTPQIEEALRFEVFFGPIESPFASWTTSNPELIIAQATLTDLLSTYGPGNLLVAQIGTYGRSPAAMITSLS
ncbi:phage tail protein [Erythrobacter sp. HA6-11]